MVHYSGKKILPSDEAKHIPSCLLVFFKTNHFVSVFPLIHIDHHRWHIIPAFNYHMHKTNQIKPTRNKNHSKSILNNNLLQNISFESLFQQRNSQMNNITKKNILCIVDIKPKSSLIT